MRSENENFCVILESYPIHHKMGVLKVVLNATGADVVDAKALVESFPCTIKTDVSRRDAEQLKHEIEFAGGWASIQEVVANQAQTETEQLKQVIEEAERWASIKREVEQPQQEIEKSERIRATRLRLQQDFDVALQNLKTELATDLQKGTDVLNTRLMTGLLNRYSQKLVDVQVQFLKMLSIADSRVSVKFTNPKAGDDVIAGTSWATIVKDGKDYQSCSGCAGCLLLIVWVISILPTYFITLPLIFFVPVLFSLASAWKNSYRKRLINDFEATILPTLYNWANDMIDKVYPLEAATTPEIDSLVEAHGDWVLWLLPNIGKQETPPECYKALKGLFWRHFLWTLWFWVPFGAIFGWLHLTLKSFRKRYLAFAALYSLVLLVPYANGFWQVNIIACISGLIHCYATFRSTFRYMIESTDGRHYELEKFGDKYNLNTIDFKTFEVEGRENDALPVLINRHIFGQFQDMSVFSRRLDLWINDSSWTNAFSKDFDAIAVSNRTKFLSYSFLFIIPVLLLCFLGGAWGDLPYVWRTGG